MRKFFISLFLIVFILVPGVARAETVSAGSIFSLVNAERTKAGLSVLAYNSLLARAAQEKATDMATRGYFDHTSPDGKEFYRWIDDTGYKYSLAGENLAANTNTQSNSAIVDAWMKSASHRDNILTAKYRESGMGVAYGTYQGREAVFVVQIFAVPASGQQESGEVSPVAPLNQAPQPAAATPVAAPVLPAQTEAPVLPTTSGATVAAATRPQTSLPKTGRQVATNEPRPASQPEKVEATSTAASITAETRVAEARTTKEPRAKQNFFANLAKYFSNLFSKLESLFV